MKRPGDGGSAPSLARRCGVDHRQARFTLLPCPCVSGIAWSCMLSTELLPRGIRINAVSPGPIDTPIFEKVGLPAEAVAGVREAMGSMVPLRRMGTADEVAAAVEFLLSPASSFVVGVELAVDGGLSDL